MGILKILLTVALVMTAAALRAEVYVVGAFSNWDISHPVTLRESEGLHSATIDFSHGESFKFSTSYPSGDDSEQRWRSFDAGTLVYDVTPKIGEWTGLSEMQKSGNMKAPAAEKLTVMVNLSDMEICFIRPGGLAEGFSRTLPVLHIDTEDSTPVTSKETYLQATCWLDPMGQDGVDAVGTRDSPVKLQIRGRGNYTWSGFKKKPYRLKFDKKQSLLGMPSGKHWALMAHADDDLGMLRSVTGFAASRILDMPWTPGSEPCEVMLNGDYIGLYFLTETIRIDKTRVNITEQADDATVDVNGGWLVEIDNYDSDPHVTVYEDGNPHAPIWFTYKSPEELSSEQSSYLTSSLTAVDKAVYDTGSDELRSMVDLNMLARYYIVQELLDDTESFHGSCYLYRDRGEDCRWTFGPVWDFGNAYRRSDYRQFVWQNPSFRQIWIGGIYRHEDFVKAVKGTWADFLVNGPVALDEEVSTMARRISAAADCDALRWPDYGTSQELAKCDIILDRLNDKIEWLKSKWGSEPSHADPIASEAQDSEDEYYSLQGMRLHDPKPGQIVIRRNGATAIKTVKH